MRSKRFLLLVGAALAVVMLWPGEAAAQRRGVRRHTGVVVAVGGYYGPAYYSPFFYDPFFFGWYPMYGQYPYPYPYGYPYGYRYGNWASARIEVKPKNAQVYIDGYYVGIVDQFDGVFQRLDVPTGGHELTVYLAGYRSFHEKAMFRPGATYHFKAILEPLPPGTPPEPQPQPQPSTAPGRDPYAGRDPYQEPPPPPRGGEGRTMPIPERRGPDRRGAPGEQAQGFGTLAVRVQPADAIVTIDGERWDSPEGGSRLVVQLSGGQHRIEVRKDGFKPYSTTVDVRPGETQSLNISLPPGEQH